VKKTLYSSTLWEEDISSSNFALLTRWRESSTSKTPQTCDTQWIGLREILQEKPIFNGKIDGFL
jgi:hypothetical protein